MEANVWSFSSLLFFTSIFHYCDNTIVSRFASDPVVEGPGEKNRTLAAVRSALNRDSKYGRWSSSRIPYRLDVNYTPFQKTAIRDAMTQIQTDVNNCVRFAEYDARTDMGEDFLNIAQTQDGVPQNTCFSAPGRDLSRKGRGQPLVMFTGAGGCMDNKRDIMKVLANALGLRNEFSRPDRDKFILIQPQNFRAEFRGFDLYRKYQPAEVEYMNFPFDHQSITMYSMDRFAMPGTVAYHLVNPGIFIGNLPRLSRGDCQGLAAHYGCSATFCPDAYANTIAESHPKDKSITINGAATWNLDDLSNFNFAKDLNQKPKGSSRRPFLIRPIAIL